jgi:DNA-binding transcriptional LysR family regulator
MAQLETVRSIASRKLYVYKNTPDSPGQKMRDRIARALLKNAVIAGLGITRLLGFQVKSELEQGQLLILFPNQLSSGL